MRGTEVSSVGRVALKRGETHLGLEQGGRLRHGAGSSEAAIGGAGGPGWTEADLSLELEAGQPRIRPHLSPSLPPRTRSGLPATVQCGARLRTRCRRRPSAPRAFTSLLLLLASARRVACPIHGGARRCLDEDAVQSSNKPPTKRPTRETRREPARSCRLAVARLRLAVHLCLPSAAPPLTVELLKLCILTSRSRHR